MSRRMDRLGDLLQQEISRVITEDLRDPRLKVLLSITRVDVSSDLQNAVVAVSLMASPEQQTEAIRALESASGHVRQLLGPRLRLRQVPKLRFVLDTSLAEGQRILSLLDSIRPREAGPHD